MFRTMLAVISLLSSTVAIAQVGGPPIGFVKGSSTGDQIYLINPDGSNLTKVYPGGRGSSGKIDRIALLPGGGKVAFTEGQKLKVQEYDTNGRPVGIAYEITRPNICALGGVDYRTDGTLLVSDGCRNVLTVAPRETTATVLFTADENISAVRWMPNDQSVLFQEGQLGSMSLKRRDPDGTISPIATVTYFPPHIGLSGSVEEPEAAVSDTYSYRIYDLGDGSSEEGCVDAGIVKLSPDGTRIVYRSPGGTLSQSTLSVHDRICYPTSRPKQVMKRGSYRDIVWRR